MLLRGHIAFVAWRSLSVLLANCRLAPLCVAVAATMFRLSQGPAPVCCKALPCCRAAAATMPALSRSLSLAHLKGDAPPHANHADMAPHSSPGHVNAEPGIVQI